MNAIRILLDFALGFWGKSCRIPGSNSASFKVMSASRWQSQGLCQGRLNPAWRFNHKAVGFLCMRNHLHLFLGPWTSRSPCSPHCMLPIFRALLFSCVPLGSVSSLHFLPPSLLPPLQYTPLNISSPIKRVAPMQSSWPWSREAVERVEWLCPQLPVRRFLIKPLCR